MQKGAPLEIGRYELCDVLATGGMSTVYLGRLHGAAGFTRVVAIKRLHPHLARDPEFVQMLRSEAHLTGQIHHPNVLPIVDVVEADAELLLVMEYIDGESLSRLIKRQAADQRPMPLDVIGSIMLSVLEGLHAAHTATSPDGTPLQIVHRDVSPQNVLVGVDGIVRVIDFGIAKATDQSRSTRPGQVKGKLAYMAPEQVRAQPVDRRSDVFAASVMLWEMLTLRRLFVGDNEADTMFKVLEAPVPPPSHHQPGISRELDAVVLQGLARDKSRRFQSAREMAEALERITNVASHRDVARWAKALAGPEAQTRSDRVKELQRGQRIASEGGAVAALTEARGSARENDRGTETNSVGPLLAERSRSRRTWVVLSAVGLVTLAITVVVGLRYRASFVGATLESPAANVAVSSEPAPIAKTAEPSVTPTTEDDSIADAAPATVSSADAGLPQKGRTPATSRTPSGGTKKKSEIDRDSLYGRH